MKENVNTLVINPSVRKLQHKSYTPFKSGQSPFTITTHENLEKSSDYTESAAVTTCFIPKDPH